MALPTRADVVAYLRLNAALASGTPSDPALALEAAFIDRSLAEATALVERHLGVPIVAVSRTMTVEAGVAAVMRSQARSAWPDVQTLLFLPLYPVSGAVTITDADGTTVDAGDYDVDALTGAISSTTGTVFLSGVHTITATVGLSAHPDYATAIEPVLSGAILDLVADRYQHREPGYSTVTAGGGVSRTHYASGLPPRAAEALALFHRVRV